MSLSLQRMAELLQPYAPAFGGFERAISGQKDVGSEQPSSLTLQLNAMRALLDLLLLWNSRTNLTAIREPEAIVQRHFGESLFLAGELAQLVSPDATLLDFGSGAGFPGLPVQIALPSLQVTLAESQGKKASFLQEAVRTLNLTTEVWANRVEKLPPSRRFHVVTLRAVDSMASAVQEAEKRVKPGGYLAILASGADVPCSASTTLTLHRSIPAPGSVSRHLDIYRNPTQPALSS